MAIKGILCSEFRIYCVMKWSPHCKWHPGWGRENRCFFLQCMHSYAENIVKNLRTVFEPRHYLVVLREYWMIYIGPGFLAVVWFGYTATHSLPPVSKLAGEIQEDRGKGGTGWARSRIIWPQESMVLYTLLNTLWMHFRNKRFYPSMYNKCTLYVRIVQSLPNSC